MAVECAPRRGASPAEALQGLVEAARSALGAEPTGPVSSEPQPPSDAHYVIHRVPMGRGELRLVEADGRPLVAAGLVPAPEGWGGSLVLGDHPGVPGEAAGAAPPVEGVPPGQRRGRARAVYWAEEPGGAPRLLRVKWPGGGAVVDAASPGAEERRLWMHCVTGWSVKVEWPVAELRRLLEAAGVSRLDGGWLLARSRGGYSAVLPLAEVWRGEVLLALPPAPGAPRLVAPRLYAWKWVKHVEELRLVEEYVDGYWEALGYHWRGSAALVERFKQWG